MPNVADGFVTSTTQSYATGSLPTGSGPGPLYTSETHDLDKEKSQSVSSGSPKPKKPRREKPRIALAPDQPPTTQGKPRARVYVACVQCRTRKIRCDGAKPVCHNCSRRTNANSECNYDPIPKRRGPDKTPGARQRAARELEATIHGPAPRRRRRNTSNTEPYPASRATQTPSEPSPILTGPLATNPSHDSPVETSGTSNSNAHVATDSEYSPGPYTCSCHGAAHCPAILQAESISNPSVSVSEVNSFDGALDSVPLYAPNAGRSYIAEVDEDGNERQDDRNTPEIGSAPSVEFSRKIWWESLLTSYMYPSTSSRPSSLTFSQRETAAFNISSDLRFIFKASNYWFSFFHIPSFFGNFFDSERRQRIQPSLVLSLLALSTFWQSSEVGYGKEGRERALRLRDEAQSAMDASFNAGWIDETLAQAAWLLALFEVCAHPRHTSYRSTSAMVMLDSIIRSLSLTHVDADDPNASLFSPGTVPVVDSPRPQTSWLPASPSSPNSHLPMHPYNGMPAQPAPDVGCSCNTITLAHKWPQVAEHAPLWGQTAAWDPSWTEAEIRKESCRRLCWSAMFLAAGHISYATARRGGGLDYDLFISDPANYAILFSGEKVARSPSLSHQSSKDTIWALHDRSFLLWHSCIRMRNNETAPDSERAQFAVKAWLEADSLEQTLNRHTCAIEKAFIFQAREYIFNTRMCISYEFQRYIPLATANFNGLFHRRKAEEWLTHQAQVAERFMYGLHTITGNATNILARRPFFVFWFMGQIHRSLSLWECDHTLTVALEVCKALIPAIDYLTALWPCPEQRLRYDSLREKVTASCHLAGIQGPPPLDLSLNIPSSPEALV
ncbi:hypothetical protein CPC08DRAFT_624611 [Agrocybe pediades]|nr:hypothetical protein CPC08DRAFT_624611 [Agrocybe pediades]